MPDSPVSHLLPFLRIDDIMGHVARVSAHDRYQASLGLERAAEAVAAAAAAAGLQDVGVQRFAADGRPQWWTFRAPVSWTPLTARLAVLAGPGPHGREIWSVDHAEQPFTVATYCIGQCASMGAILLTAGAPGKRFALPNSRIMIHQPLAGMEGTATELEIHAKELLKMKRRMNEILLKHTGRTVDEIERDTDRDKFMSAEEAAEYGLIDKVLERVELPNVG